jgi:DNA-binding Lrp family transcriptional regulator
MPKKAITLIASEKTFKNLSSFSTIEDLNKDVRSYKEKFVNELNKTALKVLDHLHRYSAKFLGCSFQTKNHIAETLQISRKTVIRACKQLEQMGIIKQYEMKRKSDMRQTSNAIVIQPLEEIVPQEKVKMGHQKDNISLKQNSRDINKRSIPEELPVEFVSSRVPKEYAKYVSIYYSNAKTVEEFHRVSEQVMKPVTYYSARDKLEISLEAFRQVIRNIKTSRSRIQNVFGYYNKVLNGILDRYYFEDLLNEGFPT